MARQSVDREDLLRDATALEPRIQLGCTLFKDRTEVFAGFRTGRAVSLFFDADPAYHFNSRGELRRAFVDDCLLKAEHGQLIRWQPHRTDTSVEMLSHPLTGTELLEFQGRLTQRLGALVEILHTGQYDVIGQVPTEGDVCARLQAWLTEFQGLVVADSPRVG